MKPFLILMSVLALAPASAMAEPGEPPEERRLDVFITTDPAATATSPAWDNQNLTYTAQVSNLDGFRDATNVTVTSQFIQGNASVISIGASQGSCSGLTCNVGTINSGEMATITLVVRPSAGLLKNKVAASSTQVAAHSAIQTSTINSSTPVAEFDWTMPQRARDADGDGIIDAGPPPGGYTPSSWAVELDACKSQPGGNRTIAGYKWEVEGLAEQTTTNCKHTVNVPREQVYPTKLTLTLNDGTTVVANKNVKVVDRFIVVMGDSYASGEGNPHVPIQYGNGFVISPPVWEDTRCHRSMWAASARAARALELQDPRSSVTYLTKACSGATIAEGILGPYKGIEQTSGAKLPPQLEQVRSIIGGARIDNLLISIGGNDAGFAKVLADCILPGDCFDNQTLINEHNSAIQGLMTSHYPQMRASIENPQTGLNVDSTFITEYPDFTTDSDGSFCDRMGDDILWPLHISQSESQWASTFVGGNIRNVLTSQVAAAKAQGLDWNFVDGVKAAWTAPGSHGHGYCVGSPTEPDPNRWVQTFTDSCDIQGPPAGWNSVFGVWFYFCHGDKTFGQFHPNKAGHQAIAQRYLASLSGKEPALDPPTPPEDPEDPEDPGDPGDPEDPQDPGDPGPGRPQLPNGEPTVGGNLPPGLPVLGGNPSPTTPAARKAGRCLKLRGKKRTRCIRKACARYDGRSRKARLKYRTCVKAVTRRA